MSNYLCTTSFFSEYGLQEMVTTHFLLKGNAPRSPLVVLLERNEFTNHITKRTLKKIFVLFSLIYAIISNSYMYHVCKNKQNLS